MSRPYRPLCIFFNMGVFYHPAGDSSTMGSLLITKKNTSSKKACDQPLPYRPF
jgi:hypothetical protein